MVLNAKFWSFPIHTYQKQPSLMIILAVRGHRKNLVFDRNSIVKNDQNSCYIHQKKAQNMQTADLG